MKTIDFGLKNLVYMLKIDNFTFFNNNNITNFETLYLLRFKRKVVSIIPFLSGLLILYTLVKTVFENSKNQIFENRATPQMAPGRFGYSLKWSNRI